AQQHAGHASGEGPTVVVHFCHGPATEHHRAITTFLATAIWNTRGRTLRRILPESWCARFGAARWRGTRPLFGGASNIQKRADYSAPGIDRIPPGSSPDCSRLQG